ncbi:hypothetical protein HHL19_11105 [Streptomyces sp. R302]|uniref:hypothetical protein n=1 Tax=unclassified Streptomyces TaxID=2593676 RepID=UPI00145C7869|nr:MULTISPECIES: hypothetical protein [unclassified Streptomyces]NML50210.1 hypothetical protein [Streptomyces sp. R301]NML79201.1 hypothetical protein [Streptomyces sp. R302]
MLPSHVVSGRRLAAAVLTLATVSAVTGALPAAPAAAAAPVAGLRAAAQDVAPFPKGATLLDGGRTGFLAWSGTAAAPYFWTAYDGTVTPLPGTRYLGAAGTDTIVEDKGDGTYVLRDMGSDAAPVVITTPGTLLSVVDATLVVRDAQGIHLVSKAGGEVVRRTVTGLPSGSQRVRSTAPGALTVSSSQTSAEFLSLVDVSTASVVRTVEARNHVLGFESVAGSKTHMTWYDYTPADDGGSFHLLDARTGEVEVLTSFGSFEPTALSEKWLAGGGSGLVLRSLADGREVTALDRVRGVRPGADGAFLVDGTLDRVEGVYRVTVGADGKPATELVASSGRLPDLAMTMEEVPSVVDFATPESRAHFAWDFNHRVEPTLTLTHKATGRQHVLRAGYQSPPPTYHFTWHADGEWRGTAPYSGEYTWKMTAEETENVGPAVERTGTLTVKRPAVARDHDENGFPDLLVRDSTGRLSAYETKQVREAGTGPLTPTVLHTGWNTYSLIASPSDRTIVGRDRDGVLWMHKGEGQKLLPRTRVGGGWQVYNKITGGSDLNGDGRGDLLATDTSGALWFYASTGDTARPFKPRVKVGGGWQIYNLLAAPGDIAGATGGDLLARDKDGVLWLYLGKGDGTFTARRKVGGGWQQFTHLAPFGDGNAQGSEDGRVDLYAIGPGGSRFYPTTGSVDRPYGSPTSLGPRSDTTFKTVF